MKKSLAFFLTLFTCLILGSCKEEGCTDPTASNFSYSAEKDNGSCKFNGCTDERALNYDDFAQEDDGSCIFPASIRFFAHRNTIEDWQHFMAIEVNESFIGNINDFCVDKYADCLTECDYATQIDLVPGIHFYRYYEIKQVGTTEFDTVYTGQLKSINLFSGECKGVMIQ